jgi:hypothetical protein
MYKQLFSIEAIALTFAAFLPYIRSTRRICSTPLLCSACHTFIVSFVTFSMLPNHLELLPWSTILQIKGGDLIDSRGIKQPTILTLYFVGE